MTLQVFLNIILGFVTGGLLMALRYQYETKKRMEERLFKDKRSLYSTFLEKLAELFLKKSKPDKIPREFMEYMIKFKHMLILYASDEVYRTFVEFVKLGSHGSKADFTPDVLAKLFLALRRDTISNTELTPKEILSPIITDIDKYYPGD